MATRVTLDEYLNLARLALIDTYPTMANHKWHPEDLSVCLETVIKALDIGLSAEDIIKVHTR